MSLELFLSIVFPTMIGAVAGGIGSYIAIRERIIILETKHASEIGSIYKHLGALEMNANRAHARIDKIRM